MRRTCVVWLFTALLTPAFGQYGQYPPGQYPAPGQYPPGQYPGGQYPNGPGGGLPIPHRSKKSAQPKKNATPNFNQDGWVLQSTASELQITTDDGRRLRFRVDADTKFTNASSAAAGSQLQQGDFVHVEAFEDEGWYLTAATVEERTDPRHKMAGAPAQSPALNQAPPAASAASSSSAEKSSSTTDDLGSEPDDPNRPHLHHGKPTRQEMAENDDAVETTRHVAAAPKTESAKEDSIDFTVGDEKVEARRKPSSYADLVERTRAWSETFSAGLPNFVCQQITTRYQENSRAEGFQPLDVVSAKVVYEDGKEDYQQITVGGRPTKKSMMELGGSTSTGEFASTLRGLFAPITQAEFKFRESSSLEHTAIAIYDLKVALPHSDWTVAMGSQDWRPGFSGSVWVDKETAEVRRIEIQADNAPRNFPADTVMETVDYEPVSLGTSKFLLPVHSENLSCFRGTSICTKNTIDFRDYHKFQGESTVEFK